jgi:hypothetical protein
MIATTVALIMTDIGTNILQKERVPQIEEEEVPHPEVQSVKKVEDTIIIKKTKKNPESIKKIRGTIQDISLNLHPKRMTLLVLILEKLTGITQI